MLIKTDIKTGANLINTIYREMYLQTYILWYCHICTITNKQRDQFPVFVASKFQSTVINTLLQQIPVTRANLSPQLKIFFLLQRASRDRHVFFQGSIVI